MKTKTLLTLTILACLLTFPVLLRAQGTAFTYQGRLQSGANPPTGLFDMTFALWTASGGGVQVGPTIPALNLGVTNGFFMVILDFGAVYNGTPYWLQIGVRTNGAVSYTPLSPRQELTPTPYAVTAENVDGLVPAAQISGTLADARLSPNVALLDHNQTFTGANIFDRGSGGPGRLIVNGNGAVDTTLFTGLGLQYNAGPGEGAIMSSYNDGFASLSFYTKAAGGRPITKQMIIDRNGVVAIDQGNFNAGFLNNGATNGAGLTFGTGSGEGIASQRTAGIDQYSLDFYTAFLNRMTILNTGFVGINTTNPGAQLDVESAGLAINGSHTATTGTDAAVQGTTASQDGSAYAVYGLVSSTSPGGFSTAVRGQNNGTSGGGIGVWGSQDGSGWGVYGVSSSGIGVLASGGSGTGLSASGGTGVTGSGYIGDGVDGSSSAATGIGVLGSHTATSGTAAGVEGTTASTVSLANGVYGLVSPTSPGSSSAGVRGQNNGTGGLGIGVYGSHAGSGWGVYGTAPSGLGVYGYSPSGIGVEAQSSSGTGVYASSGASALTIGSGAIHVSGASTNSQTTAFIHLAVPSSILANYTIITNSICDGDPNALLLVTPTISPHGGSAPYNNHPIGVWYNGSHWTIFEEDSAVFVANTAYNVLIIKN